MSPILSPDPGCAHKAHTGQRVSSHNEASSEQKGGYLVEYQHIVAYFHYTPPHHGHLPIQLLPFLDNCGGQSSRSPGLGLSSTLYTAYDIIPLGTVLL